MKVVKLILLMFVVFLSGKIVYNTQVAITLLIFFLLLYGLYESVEYIKKQLKRLFLDLPPDASAIFIKYAEDLKNIIIVLVLGSIGLGVNTLFMSLVKNDFEYLRTFPEKCQENWPMVSMIILVLYITYYLLWIFSFVLMWVKAFCILLSFHYAPATPSNKKKINELDAKMKKYLPFSSSSEFTIPMPDK